MPIWLDFVCCTIDDHYLSKCSHRGWGTHNCAHSEDAGVACTGTYAIQEVVLNILQVALRVIYVFLVVLIFMKAV